MRQMKDRYPMAARAALLSVAAVAVLGCQGKPAARSAAGSLAGASSPWADVSPGELSMILAELARAHEQKKLLSWWVGAPLIGKPVGPAFKPFYASMGPKQDELLKEITAWAKANKVSLDYAYRDDNSGRALKIMEARQEKLVRADGTADFERDMLFQMYNDYEWQISTIEAFLPRVKDAGLRAYLEKSMRVHGEGSAEILGLMRRFRFGG